MPWLSRLTSPTDLSVPRCTFTEPEVASVGFTSASDAQSAGHASAQETKVPMSTFDRAVCEGTPEGFVRFVHLGSYGKVIGAVVCGAGAGELVAELAVVRNKGLTMRDVATTMHPYPSLAFGLQVAAANQVYAGLQQTTKGCCFCCFRLCCCGPSLHGD